MTTAAARVLARADELATHSAREDGIERAYLTRQHAAVNALAAGWMGEAGLRPWQDAAGNQCGRRVIDADERPALLLGSHLWHTEDRHSVLLCAGQEGNGYLVAVRITADFIAPTAPSAAPPSTAPPGTPALRPR